MHFSTNLLATEHDINNRESPYFFSIRRSFRLEGTNWKTRRCPENISVLQLAGSLSILQKSQGVGENTWFRR